MTEVSSSCCVRLFSVLQQRLYESSPTCDWGFDNGVFRNRTLNILLVKEKKP